MSNHHHLDPLSHRILDHPQSLITHNHQSLPPPPSIALNHSISPNYRSPPPLAPYQCFSELVTLDKIEEDGGRAWRTMMIEYNGERFCGRWYLALSYRPYCFSSHQANGASFLSPMAMILYSRGGEGSRGGGRRTTAD